MRTQPMGTCSLEGCDNETPRTFYMGRWVNDVCDECLDEALQRIEEEEATEISTEQANEALRRLVEGA